jgi:proteic killer suppression protein
VEIRFRTNRLQRQYERSSVAVQAYGRQVARKYVQRIDLIKHSRSVDELQKLPGLDCHPLKGDREGQWAIKLTGFYRLIFTLDGERLEIALIEEVSKHYDD